VQRQRWVWGSALVLALAVGAVGTVLVQPDHGPTTASSPAAVSPGPTTGAEPTTSTVPTTSPGPPASASAAPYLGSLTPYAAPASDPPAAPAGFRAVFTEHVGRHGARTLTSDDDGDRARSTWRRAARAGALTDLGADLGPALDRLTAAMAAVGYGHLSTRGEEEQRALGRREGLRLAGLFADAGSVPGAVRVVTSGRSRAQESAASFVAGLRSTRPGLAVAAPRSDPRLLHFDTTDPAYADFLRHGTTWRAALARSERTVDVEQTADDALRRLYRADFVDGLADPVAEVGALYDLVRVAPGMARDVDVDLAPFLTAETTAVLGFGEDARYFYSRGPGVTGDDRSHRAAEVLLEDFFARADERLAGGATAAVYRFAHAEEVAPLAALLELPGSQALGSSRDVYTWQTSSFRTAQVVPLSASISWTLWRDGDGQVLVSVRANEVPVALGRSCRPEPQAPGYYRYAELERCLRDR